MSVYTSSLGLPPLNGTIVLAVFNLASVIGQILFGHLCDIVPYSYIITVSGAGASLSAYLLRGFAHKLALIFVFVVIFGSLSGGFSSIWSAACSEIVGINPQNANSNVFGVFGMIKA
ncbi:major facilitator superfamily transporter [Ceratobasidium sp. AG-Ba]|nr:major facilitator superfamily transporter [Ceratobasidium sp. AG-Ba]